MARRQSKKLDLISSSDNTDFIKAGLFTVKEDGFVDYSNDLGLFLLNPSTWEESKSSNWVENQIPGQSDPVLQWLHSGPRTLSFEALVTKDTSEFDSAKSDINRTKQSTTQSFIADIASSFFNLSLPTPRTDLSNAQSNMRNFDISSRLNYYRSLLYPIYDSIPNPKKLRQSPPLLVLKVGNTISKDKDMLRISPDNDVWVLTNLRIRITKQLPNLTPMEATVNFELKQYTIKSLDRNRLANG